MPNYGVSPSTQGVRPAMSKFYDGKNTATRPIPIIVDSAERRAIGAAAADSTPKVSAVNMPSGPRVGGVAQVFGVKVTGSARVQGGVYNPLIGGDNTL